MPAAAIEYKRAHLTIKQVDLVGSTFEGFSAGIGNTDDGGDIILPGAFKKSIKERVPSKAVKWLDQHRSFSGVTHLLGFVGDAKEVVAEPEAKAEFEGLTHQLWSKFIASKKQTAQDALRDIDEGILDGLSIGFRPIVVEFEKADGAPDRMSPELAWLFGFGTRKIKELAWWETSSVIWGMNEAALVIPDSVKSLMSRMEAAAQTEGELDERDLLYAYRDLKQLVEQGEGVPEMLRDPEILTVSKRLDALLEIIEKHHLAPVDHTALVVSMYEEFQAQVTEANKEVGFGIWMEGEHAKTAETEEEKDPTSDAEVISLLSGIKDALTNLPGLVAHQVSKGGGEGSGAGELPEANAEAAGTKDASASAEDGELENASGAPDPADVKDDKVSDQHFPDNEDLEMELAFLKTLQEETLQEV